MTYACGIQGFPLEVSRRQDGRQKLLPWRSDPIQPFDSFYRNFGKVKGVTCVTNLKASEELAMSLLVVASRAYPCKALAQNLQTVWYVIHVVNEKFVFERTQSAYIILHAS